MDYIALSRELTFSAGDPMTQQCVNITIVDDTAVESSPEFFSVQATSTLLATARTASIILNDNDG